jgi:hypothetical protein
MRSTSTLYQSIPCITLFDNDTEPPPLPSGVPASPPQSGSGGEARFTQEDLNRILADDRRKHQAKLSAALEQAAASKGLAPQEREALEAQIDAMKKESMSAAERAAHEKKQLEAQAAKRIADAEATAKQWQSRFEQQTIQSALRDASHRAGAFSDDQVLAILGPATKIVPREDGKFDVVVQVADQDGNTVEASPREALKTLQNNPSKWGNLFKTGVVAGVGAGNAQGSPMTAGGKVDPRKLTTTQLIEIRSKNPELLGLRPTNKKGSRY